MAYKVVYQQNDRRVDRTLEGRSVGVGRDPDNDLMVEDLSVSRFHARFERRGQQWRIVDADSRNGVSVNGLAIARGDEGAHPLNDGDTIMLGAFALSFARDERQLMILSEDARSIDPTSSTTIRPVTDFKRLIHDTGQGMSLPREAQQALERAEKILGVVTSLGQRIAAVKPFEEIIESIVDLVFESTPAQRAGLLLWDQGSGQLVPKVVRDRARAGVGEFLVPQSIVSRAFKERCTIQLAPEEGPTGGSIERMGLRSAVAVPLWDETTVVGVVYADSALHAGVFDPFSLALLSALANYAAITITQARMLVRLQQEERWRDKLSRYHAPAVMARILSSGDSSPELSLTAQESEVTVVFADMVDFTSASERLTPPQVMLLLNHYFVRLTDVIFEHEGTLDKFIGDCIMAVFGAPLPQPDHARRAALAALSMRDAVRATNLRRSDGGMEFRIGMNSGAAVSGDVGNARRKEWTVLGSTVNVAARMQSLAPPGGILLTEDTRRLLGDGFEVRALGPQRPKGLQRDIEVFELLGARETDRFDNR